MDYLYLMHYFDKQFKSLAIMSKYEKADEFWQAKILGDLSHL